MVMDPQTTSETGLIAPQRSHKAQGIAVIKQKIKEAGSHMIYTVTFNPSLDYIVRVNNFKAGVINRTYYENILPGGKGINVSIVLSNLGHDSVALGFMAGFTG